MTAPHTGGPGPADLLAAAGANPAPARELTRAYRELSELYRGGGATPPDATLTEKHVRAYRAARLPATPTASRAVLAELAARRPGWAPTGLLDLGAGPGPASWAALAAVPGISRVDLVERSALMIETGRRLARDRAPVMLRAARWHHVGAENPPDVGADLTVAAYLLGELPEDTRERALAAWWRVTAGDLVIIDAGTPAGNARVLAARGALLAVGARITAPCPTDGACPLPAGDWCHFARRVERSALHRALKDADRGHEDEKYAYLIASRQPPRTPPAGCCARRSPALATCASPCAPPTAAATSSSPAAAASRTTGGRGAPTGATPSRRPSPRTAADLPGAVRA